MTRPSTAAILRQLWSVPGTSLYAVVDGARDERVHRDVMASGVPWACLYAGDLPQPLVEVAPYLVRLLPEHPFTEELVERGWGQSWGVFVAARADLEEMRRHLRRFLRVQTEAKKTLVFRFYDPRVMRAYLPTCTREELSTFFGPAEAMLLEEDEAREMLVFSRAGTRFGLRRVAFGAESISA